MSAPCDRFERDHLAELLALDELAGEPRAHLAGCADCSARAASYERIAVAMREVGALAVRRPDHLARLWAQIDEPRRRPGRWWWAGTLAAGLAAAVALAWWLRAGDPAPRFAVEVVHGDAVALRGDARLGDRLRVRARTGTAVWIYRNDRELLLACPRACSRDGDAVVGEIVLDAVARYQIVWLSTDRTPAPGQGIERDIAVASASGADHELREIVVE